MVDFHGFYQHLVTTSRVTAVAGITDIASIFGAICQAEELLLFGHGDGDVEQKNDTNVVNGHLPVLFTVEGTNGRKVVEEMLEVMQDAPVPALADLALHFMAQGLVLEDMGEAPARTMNMPRCLLIPMAW
eukprot:12056259-Ditylum_brightwellii.AAC.1